MGRYYRLTAYANLPRSDMQGYYRSYDVFCNDELCHQHLGYSDNEPEAEEGRHVFSDRDVWAENPFEVVRKFEEWESSGKPSSFLTEDI